MKTVLIIHGIEGYSGIHWQQWLYDQLIKREYKVIMPDMPKAAHPDREEWLRTVKDLTKNVDFSELILVGHSLGVPTALDLIKSENKKIKALISVSGFAEDYGAELNSYFLKEKELNFEKIRKSLEKAFVVYGNNDPYVPQKILQSLADELKVKPLVIKNGGHLNTDAGYKDFPELLEIIEKLSD